MTRIAFIAPFGLGQKTTVWARTLPLARFLAQQGHTVTLLIPPWDTPKDAGRHWNDQGVQVVNVAVTGSTPLVVARLLQQLVYFQPQLVHIVKPRAHAGLVQWLLWQQRRLTGRGPRIVLDVDDWEQAWAAINPYHPLVARFLAWQEEWGIRHADGITAASQWLMERVQRYTPSTPVCYLPNGVVRDTQAPVRNSTPDQVLFVSRYVEVEPAWLATFWCALTQAQPRGQLTVFGDPLQAERRALFTTAMAAHCPQAAGQVRWLAYDPALAQQLYAECTCAIFPSQKTALHEAKCSVRLATTLLYGVPVIASAVGEQVHYGAAGAAYLVPAEASPADFAAAVAQALTDPDQQAALRQQGRQQLLATYDWAKLGTRLEQFYTELEGK